MCSGTRVPSTMTIKSATRRIMTRPSTYETIYSNDTHHIMNSVKTTNHKLPTTGSKHRLFSSKTSDNLLCTQAARRAETSGYQRSYCTLPRSISLHSPIAERAQVLPSVKHSVDTKSAGLMAASSRRYHSSYSLVNTIKHIVTPASRSRTVDERICLL